MSLEVVDTLKGGLEETFTSRGLKFIGLAYLINLVSSISSQSLFSQLGLYEGMGSAYTMTSLALEGPTALWTGLSLIASLAGLWLTIGVLRNFVNNRSEEIDTDFFTENLGMTFLNLFIGTIVFSLIVGLGFVLLVIPGIFLLVSLIFWTVYVAVEDENFIEAMKSSWNLAKGNRIDLLLIGVGTVIVGLLATVIAGIPGAIAGTVSPQLSALITMAANAFGTVFTLATLAHAYRQLN
jgi:hypothetical protein